ncbi:MAG TPA: autotransporter domain-containing protein [bacterium]|nr:autotransporter domain-containing protein [bacterium]
MILAIAALWAGFLAPGWGETWLNNPPSGDFDSGSNWDLSTVPSGTSASATFGTSLNASVTMSAPTTVGDVQFNGSTSYTIYNNGQTFVLAGLGANNTSGQAQTLIATGGLFLFENGAQAVSVLLLNSAGATLRFQDTSSAGIGTIADYGRLIFTGSSTAGSVTILAQSGGSVSFSGGADGGLAQLDLATGADLDISQSTVGVTLGSLAGGGNVNLGTKNLTTGGNNLSTSYSGVISGAGSLIKNGPGLMILSGDNLYSGGTTIFGGTVVVDGGSLGSGPVSNQATLTYALDSMAVSYVVNSGTLSFQDDATAGTAVISNSSILAFNNSASAVSAVLYNSGTLNFNGDSTAANAGVSNSGLLNFNDGASAANAAISNTGAVYFQGASATTLASAGNAHIDDMNIVQFGDFSTAGDSRITVENSSTLNFAGNAVAGTAQFTLNSGGVLDISGETSSALTVTYLNSLAGSAVQLGGNRLVFGGNLSSSIAGVVTGAGGSLVKSGTGTLTLSGTNNFTGSTQLTGGQLLLASSGALGGCSVSFTGGTMATSGGPITVNVGGSYQQTGGTLQLGLAGTSAGQWDRFNVTGDAQMGGSVSILSVAAFTPVLGDSFRIFETAGLVSGSFSDSISSIAGFRFLPVYGTHEVDLVAIRPSFLALALTLNQKAVAAALDASVFESGQQDLMADLGTMNAGNVPAAYDRVSPAGLTPIFRMGYDLAQARGRMAFDRIASLWEKLDASPRVQAAWNGRMFAAAMDGSGEQAMTGTAPRATGVFAQGLGNFGTVTGDGNGPGYQFSTGGVAVGLDDRMDRDLVGGLLVGYSQSGTSQALDSVKASGGQVGVYGGWRSGDLRIAGLLDGGINNYDTVRAGEGGMATGTARGMQFGLKLGGNLDWDLDGSKWGPLAAGSFTHVQVDGFTETGSFGPLNLPAQGQDELASELGLQAKRNFPMGGGWFLEPALMATWQHVYQGNLDQVTASLAGSSNRFVVDGPALGRDGFLVSAGLRMGLGKGLAVQLGYQGVLGVTNFDSQDLSGGISLNL